MDNEKLAGETPVVAKAAGRGQQKGSAFLSPVPSEEAPEPKTLEPKASEPKVLESKVLESKTPASLPTVTETGASMDLMDPGERDGIFRQLVTADSDIAGLVAYSIYKQNKLDWLTAFEQAKGRAPNGDEQASYVIGESTQRRLVTYRHLAEAMLAGTGPVAGTGGAQASGPRGPTTRGTLTPALISAYALIAVLLLIGFFVTAHYTMTSR